MVWVLDMTHNKKSNNMDNVLSSKSNYKELVSPVHKWLVLEVKQIDYEIMQFLPLWPFFLDLVRESLGDMAVTRVGKSSV